MKNSYSMWVILLVLLIFYCDLCNAAFTEPQQAALAIIPKVTSWFSIFGSLFILNSLWRIPKRKRNTYHRFMFCMSLSDFFVSIAYFMSTWPIPATSQNVEFNKGSMATCTAQAFFIQFFALVTIFYNACLVVNYLALLYFGWMPHRVEKIEPFCHFFAISFPLATAITSIPLGLYGNANLWCWITQRGYQYGFFYGPFWGVWFFVLFSMIMIWYKIHVHEAQMKKLKHDDNGKSSKSREVAIQGTLYVCAFCVAWIFGTINRTYQAATGVSSYPLLVLHCIFVPLQGFFNSLVFGRSTHRQLRSKNPKTPRGRLWGHLFFPCLVDIEEPDIHSTEDLTHVPSQERPTTPEIAGKVQPNSRTSAPAVSGKTISFEGVEV